MQIDADLLAKYSARSRERVRVEDADTVQMPGEDETTRLAGFDARETAKFGRPGQPTAGLATDVTQQAFDDGATLGGEGRDHYGRHVRTATRADGEDHGEFMIRQGLGVPTSWSTQAQANQEIAGSIARSGLMPEMQTPEERDIKARRDKALEGRPWTASPAQAGTSGGVRMGTTRKALSRGLDNTQVMFNAFGHAVADQFGAEGVAEGFKDRMERNQRQAAATPPEVASWDDVTLKNFPTYALEAVAENLPNMGITLAGGLAAAASGGTLPVLLAGAGGAAARQALWSAGKRFAMGSAAASYGLNAGSVQQELLDAGIDASGTALIAGIPMSALDALGMTAVVGSVFKGAAKKEALKIIEASGAKLYKEALAGAGRGLAVGGIAEGVTEALQEAIILSARAYEDPTFELFTEENMKRIREGAIKGAIAGGVMSGAGSAVVDTVGASYARREAKELGITPESTEADVEAAIQTRAETRERQAEAARQAAQALPEAESASPIQRDPETWLRGQFEAGTTNRDILRTMPEEVKAAYPSVKDLLAQRKAYEEEAVKAGPAAAPPVQELVTWDTLQPGQMVTLYRGESAENIAGGSWWTTDRAKAERFGRVQERVFPAEILAKSASRGHGGTDEFFFAGGVPPTQETAPRATPEAPRAQNPVLGTPLGEPGVQAVAPATTRQDPVAEPAATAQVPPRGDLPSTQPEAPSAKPVEVPPREDLPSAKPVLPRRPRTPVNLHAKDQAKSDQATQFIGRGAPGSSTALYESAWGELANTGTYTADDTVFVSVNGATKGRVGFDGVASLVAKAVEAGATIVTDTLEHRTKSFYNVGEREAAAFLEASGYTEVDGSGIWKPAGEAPSAKPVEVPPWEDLPSTQPEAPRAKPVEVPPWEDLPSAKPEALSAKPEAPSTQLDDYIAAEKAGGVKQLNAMAKRVAKRFRLPSIQVLDTATALKHLDDDHRDRILNKRTLRGVAITVANSDGSETLSIWVDPRIPDAARVGVLAHELGHHLQKTHWYGASAGTKAAVIKEYNAWLVEQGVVFDQDGLPDFSQAPKFNTQRKMVKSRTSFLLQEWNERLDDTAFADRPPGDKLAYWAAFDEWFADQVSRALLQIDVEATNPVQAFFQEVAEMIRDLYNEIVTKTGIAPAPSVEQFVRDIMMQRVEETTVVDSREVPVVEAALPPLESYENAGYGDERDGGIEPDDLSNYGIPEDVRGAKDDITRVLRTQGVLSNPELIEFTHNGHTLSLPLTVVGRRATLTIDGVSQEIPATLLMKAILANPETITKAELIQLALESRVYATRNKSVTRYAFDGKVNTGGATKPVREHPLLDAYPSASTVDIAISREVAYRKEDEGRVDIETQYKQALTHLRRDLDAKNKRLPPEKQTVMVARKKGQVLLMSREERDALYARLGLSVDAILEDTNVLGRVAATVFRVGGHKIGVDLEKAGEVFDSKDNDGTVFISSEIDGIVQGTLLIDYEDGTVGIGKGTGRGVLEFQFANGKTETEKPGLAKDLLFGRKVTDKRKATGTTLHITQLDGKSGSAFPYQSVLADLQDPAGYLGLQNRMIEQKGVEGIASPLERQFIGAGWPASLTINKEKFAKILKQMKLPAVRDYAIGSSLVPRDGVVFLEDTLTDYLKAAGLKELKLGDTVYLHREPSLPTGTGTIAVTYAGTASFGPSARQRRGIVVNPKNPKIKGLALDFDGDRLVAIAPHEGFVPRTLGNADNSRPVDRGDLTALVNPSPKPLTAEERARGGDPIETAIIRDADGLEDRVGEAINLANKLIESGYNKNDAAQLRLYVAQIAQAMISSVKKAVSRDETMQLYDLVFEAVRGHAEARGDGSYVSYITSMMGKVMRTPAKPLRKGDKSRLTAFREMVDALRARGDGTSTPIEEAMLRRAEILLDQHDRTGLLDGEAGRVPKEILRAAQERIDRIGEDEAGTKIAALVAEEISALNTRIRAEQNRMLREFDETGEIVETEALKDLRRQRSDLKQALAIQVRLGKVDPAAVIAQSGLAPSVTTILRPADLRQVYDRGATFIEAQIAMPDAQPGQVLPPGTYNVEEILGDDGETYYILNSQDLLDQALFKPQRVVGTAEDRGRTRAFLEKSVVVQIGYPPDKGPSATGKSFRVQMQRLVDVETGVGAVPETDGWQLTDEEFSSPSFTLSAFDDAPAPLSFMHSRRLGNMMSAIRTAWDRRDNNETYLSFIANADWAARNTIQTVGSWMRNRGPIMKELGGMFLRTTDARADYTGNVGPWETAHRMHFARIWNLGFNEALQPLRKKERLLDKALQQDPGLKVDDPQYKRVMDILAAETPLEQIADPSDAAIVEGIRDALTGALDYSNRVFGMGIERRANYWPIVVDMVRFENERERIVQKLMGEVGLPRAQAEAIWEDVVHGEGSIIELIEDQLTTRDTHAVAPGFEWSRRRKWSPAVHAALREYQLPDIGGTLARYVGAMAKRGTTQKMFGRRRTLQNGKTVMEPLAKVDEMLRAARESGELSDSQYRFATGTAIPALFGQLGLEGSPQWRALSAWGVTYQNLRLLGMVVFSSFVDSAIILSRNGVRATFGGIKDMIAGASRAEVMDQLRDLGAMRTDLTEAITNDAMLMNAYYGAMPTKINETFFRVVQMHRWTNFTRRMALGAAKRHLLEHAAQAERSPLGVGMQRLKAVGVTAEQVRAWERDGMPIGREDHEAINFALNQIIDDSVLRPTAAIRPGWASDARLTLLAHLKAFFFAFYERALRQVWTESVRVWGAEKGAMKAMAIMPALMLTLPALLLSAVGYELRRKIGWWGDVPPYMEKDGLEYIFELSQRAGIYGPLQFVLDAESSEERGRSALLAILGPQADQFQDLYKGMDYALWRAIPGLQQLPAARQWLDREVW